MSLYNYHKSTGPIKTYKQTAIPTGAAVGDIWADTSQVPVVIKTLTSIGPDVWAAVSGGGSSGNGYTGSQGPAGVGFTGSQGIQGVVGFTGSAGSGGGGGDTLTMAAVGTPTAPAQSIDDPAYQAYIQWVESGNSPVEISEEIIDGA